MQKYSDAYAVQVRPMSPVSTRREIAWNGGHCSPLFLPSCSQKSTFLTMAIFRSGNPALKASTFEKSVTSITPGVEGSVFLPNEGTVGTMTERGTLNKFFFLFLMVMGAATFAWYLFEQGTNMAPWVMGSAIGGLILALIISFRPTTAPYLSPAYAL
ncbi:MAG TPA: Bax inhibitor-1/YccA family protein, partial [Fibrella sp.]